MPDTQPHDNGARLWALVAEHAATRGRRAGVADACAVAVTQAHLSGAGVTMMTRAHSGRVVCVTDDVSARVEELQLTLGEGPCMDAHASSGPVLSADLRGPEAAHRWPAFAPAAAAAGAAALFAFPLRLGTLRLGVMDLYHDEPRPLLSGELRDALILADAATLLLVGQETVPATDADGAEAHDGLFREREGYRAEIDQATGMVSVQLGTGIDDAFARLRGYAYAHDHSLTDVARDVVARRLRFVTDPDGDPNDRGAVRNGGDR